MISAIVEGKADTADLFFLFATILAFIAAVLYALATRPAAHTAVDHEGHVHRTHVSVWAPVAGWLAVACFSLAWFVL